ncbi:MAG: hypothetical protein IRZ21_06410 [Thermoleophilaceae bacterium]|nr:hypothetical protein [Thermoleophilaceae bacterium]
MEGAFPIVVIAVSLAALVVAAIAFAGAGKEYERIGKGPLALERGGRSSPPGPGAARAELEAEVRQLVEAKAARGAARGEAPLDVEAEVARRLRELDPTRRFAASPQSGIDTRMASGRRFDLDELLIRPGTYFNPQTEVMVIVDDSPSIDSEIFNLEEFEGADWILIGDELPLDEARRDELLEGFQARYHGGDGRAVPAEEDDESDLGDD